MAAGGQMAEVVSVVVVLAAALPVAARGVVVEAVLAAAERQVHGNY